MNQLNLLVWAWIESVKDMMRLRVIAPFVLLGAAQLVVLLSLTQFFRPGLSWLLAPFVERFGGERALHYPEFFLRLPAIYDPVTITIDWIVGSFLLGVGVLLVWESASGTRMPDTWKRARSRYLGLLAVSLPTVLLLMLFLGVLPSFFPVLETLRGNLLRLYGVAKLAVAAVIQALFVYSAMYVLIDGQTWRAALGSSLRLLARVPVATLLLVLAPNFAQIGTTWIRRRMDTVVTNLSPEMVVVVLGGIICIYVLVNYIVVASAVRVYGARRSTQAGSVSWAA